MPNPKLSFNFVAFLDILGYSNMVISDCESDNSEEHINKFLDIQNHVLKLHNSIEDLNLIQFSDSVVFSLPYSKSKFELFLQIISLFQYELFKKGILCRGGVAYGKHFHKEGFLFSNGLINAYNLERKFARNPRIVISEDLMNLLYTTNIEDDLPLIKENDGLYFIDFIGDNNLFECKNYLTRIVDNSSILSISVKEKHRWLTEYLDYKIAKSDEPIEMIGNGRFFSE